MDLGIVTSYIIAGMIFLAITMMTLSLSQSTTELTLNQNARKNVQSVAEMLSYDFPKIGYNKVISITNPITYADENKITFQSNIDNSDDKTVETITWEFTTDPVATSGNPNDYKLLRVQDGDVTEITLGVTHFNIRYYSDYGLPKKDSLSTPVSNPELIKQIEIELVCESPAPIGNRSGSDRYLRSAWDKRFSPGNLE